MYLSNILALAFLTLPFLVPACRPQVEKISYGMPDRVRVFIRNPSNTVIQPVVRPVSKNEMMTKLARSLWDLAETVEQVKIHGPRNVKKIKVRSVKKMKFKIGM